MANILAVKSNLSFLMVQLDALKISQIFPQKKVRKKQPQMKLSQPYIYSQLSLNGHLSKRELTIRVIFWHKNNVSGSDVADDIQVIDKTNLTDSSSVCDPFLSQRSLPSLSLPPTEVISRFSYKLNGIISINAVQLSNLLWN